MDAIVVVLGNHWLHGGGGHRCHILLRGRPVEWWCSSVRTRGHLFPWQDRRRRRRRLLLQ